MQIVPRTYEWSGRVREARNLRNARVCRSRSRLNSSSEMGMAAARSCGSEGLTGAPVFLMVSLRDPDAKLMRDLKIGSPVTRMVAAVAI
jgi:hypothetical protein